MKKPLGTFVASFFLVLCLTLLATRPTPAQDVQTRPIVMHDVAHDISLPVRMYPALTGRVTHRVFPERRGPRPPQVSVGPDAVLQDLELFARPPVAAAITLNFDGISDRDGVAPPDTNASVGATQVVETVNLSYQVYNKATGASVHGPAEIASIFTGLSGGCTTDGNLSDPVVLYDKAAGRWVISILAFNGSFSQTDECIEVSTSSDATGSYNRYDFSFGANLPDYQKMAVWPDAYYFSGNIFPNGGFFTGAEACAFNRAAMQAGTAATAVCFARPSSDFSLLPSDLDGATQPAAGEPDFYLELSSSSTTALNLYQFHVDFSNTNNSTFTGPTTVSISSYSDACPINSCVPQSGTTQKLDALGDRLMHRLAYRNFGDHEALVATHSIKGNKVAANVRWYEIRSPQSPVLFQSGTLASGSTALWLGSIAMDKAGDIALGFSESSAKIHPAIQFTGRIPTDPSGTMESIATIKSGAGSQNGGLDRWGDYSSMAIDPSDDCTFWYANEYIPRNGSFNWNTRLANFKFTNCH
jgi:hypothetical protein